MVERIIIGICCILCAFPLLIIGKYDKDSITPITFWSGDNTLKEKVKNIKAYNEAMAKVYRIHGTAFLISAVASLIHPLLGIGLLLIVAVVGWVIDYKCYKKILAQNS